MNSRSPPGSRQENQETFAESLALRPGEFVGPFQLLSLIARGGMGEVWLANTPVSPGEYFAVKTILSNLADNARVRQSFIDEVRLSSRLIHPNIARVLDSGEDNQRLFVAMEYLPGETFRTLQKDVKKASHYFPTELALFLVSEACKGLHYAHELRSEQGVHLEVVHRDISPHNIFITESGEIKLIDFGIAKAKDRMGGETTSGTVKGKIDYMAPEQASGSPVDRRADVYGLGATLYALLSGSPPYNSSEIGQVVALTQLLAGILPPPLPSHIPLGVQNIVFKSLSRDPAMRYQTALEFHHALRAELFSMQSSPGSQDVASFVNHYSSARIAKRKKLFASLSSHHSEANEFQSMQGSSVGNALYPDASASLSVQKPVLSASLSPQNLEKKGTSRQFLPFALLFLTALLVFVVFSFRSRLFPNHDIESSAQTSFQPSSAPSSFPTPSLTAPPSSSSLESQPVPLVPQAPSTVSKTLPPSKSSPSQKKSSSSSRTDLHNSSSSGTVHPTDDGF